MQTQPRAWNMLHVSACLTGLAALQYEGDSGVLAAAARLLPQLLPSASARDISNFFASFSKRQYVLSSDVVIAVSVRFLDIVSQASPRDIANLLYGLAMMGAAPSEQLVDACAERVAASVGQASAQDIANTIWALGKLPHCSSAHIRAMLQADAIEVHLMSYYCTERLHVLIHCNACRLPRCKVVALSYKASYICRTVQD